MAPAQLRSRSSRRGRGQVGRRHSLLLDRRLALDRDGEPGASGTGSAAPPKAVPDGRGRARKAHRNARVYRPATPRKGAHRRKGRPQKGMLSPKPPPPMRAATTLMVQRRTILALGREILRPVVSVCVPRWPRRTCGAHRKMKRAARALRGGAAAARPLPEAAALTHKDIRAYTQNPRRSLGRLSRSASFLPVFRSERIDWGPGVLGGLSPHGESLMRVAPS